MRYLLAWLRLAWWRFARRFFVRCTYLGRHAPDRRHLFFPELPDGDRAVAMECQHCGRFVTEQGLLVRSRTPLPLTVARASMRPKDE